MSTGKRIEVILKDPNPIFVKWLKEWLKDAERKNSKSKYNLKEALNSLERFPLPLRTGRECGILKGFGPTLCNFIDQKLELYKQSNLNEYEKSINIETSVKKVVNYCNQNQKQRQKEKRKKQKINLDTATSVNSSSQNSCNSQFLTQKSSVLDKKVTCTEKERIILEKGSFEIVLLVDTQETIGKFKKNLDDTKQYLESKKIKYEIRRLGVGDFCWIGRDNQQNELILPYMIERKRMDDFSKSIRDGRFHEQKFRLRESGIPNLIYLIESYGNNQHVGIPMSTLMQAATNTQIHSEFQIKFTDNHRHSMFYISTLTKILTDKFKDKLLIETEKSALQSIDLNSECIKLMNFREFQQNSSKTKQPSLKEIFIKQLLQLKSLSIDKALAIVNVYPTPRSLILAYKSCTTEEEGEMLLANIPSGKLKRPVGAAISKIMYLFYNTHFDKHFDNID